MMPVSRPAASSKTQVGVSPFDIVESPMDDVEEMPRAEGGPPGSMRSPSSSSSSSSCSRPASLPRAGVKNVRWQDHESVDDDDHPPCFQDSGMSRLVDYAMKYKERA